MTSESSEQDDPDVDLKWHREQDRHVWDEFWESPTFEKWRKGGKWT
jgi:hypothetical protein